jgi:hypothetical protein
MEMLQKGKNCFLFMYEKNFPNLTNVHVDSFQDHAIKSTTLNTSRTSEVRIVFFSIIV